MKDVKKNAVRGQTGTVIVNVLQTFKFNKTNYSTVISASYQEHAIQAIHIEMHHTTLQNSLGQTSFINGINFTTLFRVC